MGQYWLPVNLDKKEFIDPHKLGSGLKLWEQLANPPGVGAALIILIAAMPCQRGGGDLDMEENWHGPERQFPRDNTQPGPMPGEYPGIARRIIGRWAGDRVVLVGDYAEDGDIFPGDCASWIYDSCREPDDHDMNPDNPLGRFTDITEEVCDVIEHELHGRFMATDYSSPPEARNKIYRGKGWREFVRDGE